MSGQPWETHDPLCPNRRPTIAFPNSACSGCRAVVAARVEGYARGLIEGDHGGRREGYRIGQRDERERIRTGVNHVLVVKYGLPGATIYASDVLAVIKGGAE